MSKCEAKEFLSAQGNLMRGTKGTEVAWWFLLVLLFFFTDIEFLNNY